MASLSLGIYAHWQKPGAAASLKALVHELNEHDINVLLEEHAAELVARPGYSLDELYRRVDLFVALGGDGTLLRLVRDLRGKMNPVMGINFGSPGFLPCVGGPEFAVRARSLGMGDYRVDERTLLEASIERKGKTIYSQIGLNDVVVTRGERSRLVRLNLFIDQTHLTEYNADGLIMATSTGSTAYSLSAGGPIVMPHSGVFVVTPICPHVLTNRSVIVSNKSTIRLVPSSGEQQLSVSVDGQESMQLSSNDAVTVRPAEEKLPLLLPKHLTFADILGAKLRWSGRDRKSTRLNSSHLRISYAVFCLKKKKKKRATRRATQRETRASVVHTCVLACISTQCYTCVASYIFVTFLFLSLFFFFFNIPAPPEIPPFSLNRPFFD